MRYLLMLFGVLLFLGCAPKYQVVNEYISPISEGSKVCLDACQKQYGSCKEICAANFEICNVKAEKEAKANFEAKMQAYTAALEHYAHEMQMYEMQRDLYFFDGYYGYYGRGGYYYSQRLFWGQPYPYFRPLRPIKPSLEEEIQKAQMQLCQIDCGCTKTYDACFIGCGGVVKTKKICVENCPDEKK